MAFIQNLLYWEVLFLLFAFFGVITLFLLNGEINLRWLFYGARGDGTVYFSPERVQLLIFTLGAALHFLSGVLHDPTKFPAVDYTWLGVLGLSNVVYLGGKAGSSFLRQPPPRIKGDTK
jgi:hypothetical protein